MSCNSIQQLLSRRLGACIWEMICGRIFSQSSDIEPAEVDPWSARSGSRLAEGDSSFMGGGGKFGSVAVVVVHGCGNGRAGWGGFSLAARRSCWGSFAVGWYWRLMLMMVVVMVLVVAVLLMVVFERVAPCIFWEVGFIARWMLQYQKSISLQLDFLSTRENQPVPSSQANAALDGGL